MFETILKRSVLLLDASQKAALRRALNCYRPEVLIESTCGKGNFIIAALEIFPSIRQVFGLEIQERYVTECKARLLAALVSRPELKREIQIQQGNIFAEAPAP